MAASTIASTCAWSSAPVTVVGEPLFGFDLLYSRSNATAEINGFGAIPTDSATVDGSPGPCYDAPPSTNQLAEIAALAEFG